MPPSPAPARLRRLSRLPTGLPSVLAGLLLLGYVHYGDAWGGRLPLAVLASGLIGAGLYLAVTAVQSRPAGPGGGALWGGLAGGLTPPVYLALTSPHACSTALGAAWIVVPGFAAGAGATGGLLVLLLARRKTPSRAGGDRPALLALLGAATLLASAVFPYAANHLSYVLPRSGVRLDLRARQVGAGSEFLAHAGLLWRLTGSPGREVLEAYDATGELVFSHEREAVSASLLRSDGEHLYLLWSEEFETDEGILLRCPVLQRPDLGRGWPTVTWRLPPDEAVGWVALVSDGVAVTSGWFTVAAFRLEPDGRAERLWSRPAETPVAAGELLLVRDYLARLVCLELVSGRELWYLDPGPPVAPLYDPERDRILVASEGWVAAVDAATGTTLWERRLETEGIPVLGLATDGVVAVVPGRSGQQSGMVAVLSPGSGAVRWQAPVELGASAFLAEAHGVILLRAGSDILLGLDLADGTRLFRLRREPVTGVLVQGDRVVLASPGGTISSGRIVRSR